MTHSTPRRGGILRKALIAIALIIVVLVVGGVLFFDSIVGAFVTLKDSCRTADLVAGREVYGVDDAGRAVSCVGVGR